MSCNKTNESKILKKPKKRKYTKICLVTKYVTGNRNI